MEFQEYGTIGQRQYGVDIRAKTRGADGLTAIQCKDYKNPLGETLIKNEYSEALQYHKLIGKISHYFIATTNESTTRYEKLINELSKGPFPISIIFWDDLNTWINTYKSIIHVIYPELVVKVNQQGDATGKFFRLDLPKERTVLEFLISKLPSYEGQFSNEILVSNPRERKCVTYSPMNGWPRLKEAFEENFDAYAVAQFIDSFSSIDVLLSQHDVTDTFYLDYEELKHFGFHQTDDDESEEDTEEI